MEVGIEDVCRDLLDHANAAGQSCYRSWKARPGYEDVVRFVHDFRHRRLFELRIADVDATVMASRHALGNIRAVEQLAEVENLTVPFAFHHIFHWCLEEDGRVPTWQRMVDWIKGPAGPAFLAPIRSKLGWDEASEARRRRLARALQWRIGKAYYSAVREVELLTRLREQHHVAAKYHLLADVLLRTDLWVDRTLVCTYFPNPRYRDGSQGRKPPSAQFFRPGDFTILHLPIQRQGFGLFWRVSENSVAEVAARIREAI